MAKRERNPPNKSGEYPRIRLSFFLASSCRANSAAMRFWRRFPAEDHEKLELMIKVIVYNTTVLIKSTQRGVKGRSRKFCSVHNFQTNPWSRNTT